MNRIAISCGMLLMGIAGTSSAQSRVEVGGFVGYTLSEGINVDPNTAIGIVVDELNPTSGLSYGFLFNVNLNENMQVGFLWDQQESNLEIKGTGLSGKAEVTDLDVRNYHGIFTYNFGDDFDSMRPYLLGGIGATQYVPGDIMGNPVDSETRFSSTWGGGVKFYPGRVFGVQVGARWTPTYIKSDPGGWWCSPYWPGGCWIVSNPDYSNQLEFTGGIVFKF